MNITNGHLNSMRHDGISFIIPGLPGSPDVMVHAIVVGASTSSDGLGFTDASFTMRIVEVVPSAGSR